MTAPATPACRPGCGACCIAPSITTPMPEMPQGKPADLACTHLDAGRRCALFGSARRPAFCAGLQPSAEMCGDSAGDAFARLRALEAATRP